MVIIIAINDLTEMSLSERRALLNILITLMKHCLFLGYFNEKIKTKFVSFTLISLLKGHNFSSHQDFSQIHIVIEDYSNCEDQDLLANSNHISLF